MNRQVLQLAVGVSMKARKSTTAGRTASAVASVRRTPAFARCLHATSAAQQIGNSRDTLELSDDALSNPIATSWKGVKRFYNNVDVKRAVDVVDANGKRMEGWQVLIQGRPLRTHAVNEFVVPTEALARAVAGEFAAQGDMIRPATMPLYNLCCMAIDTFVTEDMTMAEDLEALHRATRLSTFDRITARAIVEEEAAGGATATVAVAGSGAGSAGAIGAGAGAACGSTDVSATGSPSSSSSSGPSDPGAGSVTRTTLSEMLKGSNYTADGRIKTDGATPSHAVTALTGRSESGALSSSGSSGTAKLRDLLLDYLETDSVCYRVDWDMADPSERLLRKRQDAHYQPLLDWFSGAHGVELGTAVGINDVEHPEEAYQIMEDAADTADPWLKAALQSLVGTLKSSVTALALVHRATDVDGAYEASRVEEEWQIGEHGFVEDGHDTGRAYTRTQLAAASTFLWLLPASAPPALPLPGKKGYDAALAKSREDRRLRVEARRTREAALVERKRAVMRQMALDEEREAAAARKGKATEGPAQPEVQA